MFCGVNADDFIGVLEAGIELIAILCEGEAGGDVGDFEQSAGTGAGGFVGPDFIYVGTKANAGIGAGFGGDAAESRGRWRVRW